MPRKRNVGKKSWVDPDDAPELTEDFFRSADLYEGERLIRRGRPRLAKPKAAMSLRLDADVLSHFRKTGAGWQSRINAALRKAAKLPKEKRRKA
ncbi:MAG: BrnA antitoxin family protein [Rhizobiales bacterium]|nr:BrnA antitoxin family protein [Hyphomicrobiales bacterium]